MRRRCFLHPEVIAASRDFVNVRLNIWLNEANFARLHTLVGDKFAGLELTGNTAFCLFESDAPGLSADSFPSEPSVFFGSRVGCLYPVCISTRRDPEDGEDDEYRAEFIKERRRTDLGEEHMDPELLERIMWERKNGADGPGLAKIMRGLAMRFPASQVSKETLPALPLIPTLRQAINFAAADSRAVIAVVVPEGDDDALSEHLASLLFEQGIAGRVHAVRMSNSEWADAKSSGLVSGGKRTSGLVFIEPEPFGRNGRVAWEASGTSDESQLRSGITRALEQFLKTWRKLDYISHLKKGVADDITWREWDPVTKGFSDLKPGEDVPGRTAPPE